ncbi:MAG: thioredoxin family protein [Gemmatimonadaceae bacterium]|nr:thioredoxin family protein [Gemmatimonadaceae bacterium]
MSAVSRASLRSIASRCREVVWRASVAGPMLLLLAGAAHGQQRPARDPSPHSDAVLISDVGSAPPGRTVTVAVRLTLDPGWHTYWINPGDAGLPLTVKWTLPPGVTAGPLQFPTPHLAPQPPLMSYGYENEVLVLTELTLPASAAVGSSLHIEGKADWLACAEVCLPATGPLSLDMPVSAGTPASTTSARTIADTRTRLPTVLAGWNTHAWSTPTGYTLALIRGQGAAPTPFVAPYFFVDSADVLEHAEAQQVTQAGDTLVLSLPRAKFGTGIAGTLAGVMLVDIDAPTPHGFSVRASTRLAVPAQLKARATALLAGSHAAGGVTAVAATAPAALALVDPTADMTLIAAMLFAFLGGLILNLMPCVFPVLSVKVLALLEHGGATNAARGRKHGLAFGVGVVLSFWILAGALMVLRAGGESLGWGFQLQSPAVVATLALLMFALGLNLSGVFEIGLSLTRLGAAGSGGSYRDSLLTGGLAVLVAAPCTAPFMGAALGYALVQPAFIGMLVFTSLAIGLALPFVVLASMPQLLRFLPRPGPWLETLKQLFAFPLYATVVWLLWVYGLQVGVDALAVLLLSMIVLALGAWMWARGVRFDRRSTRLVAAGLMVFAVGVAALGGRTPQAGASGATARYAAAGVGNWEPYSAQRVTELRAEGRPIFIDFTAAWCLSCQVNERVALRTDAVRDAFERGNVALLRADWTSRDSSITNVLASFGRSGVPLYVLYPAGKNSAGTILPAVLTPGFVVNAVRNAAPATLAIGADAPTR